MSSMMWWIIGVFPVWAEEITVRVAVDDRQQTRLSEPSMTIGYEVVALTDNGKEPGDVANDGIFVGVVRLEREESLLFVLENMGEQVGQIEASVPKLEKATFQFKTTVSGLILDLNAPLMPSEQPEAPDMTVETPVVTSETVDMPSPPDLTVMAPEIVQKDVPTPNVSSSEISNRLNIQAESLKKEIAPEGTSICRIFLNAKQRPLNNPNIMIDGKGEAVQFVDDGSFEFDRENDGIWVAELQMAPTESIQVLLADGETTLGLAKLALPSSPVSKVDLKYTDYGLSSLLASETESKKSLIVQAAPKGDAVVSTGDDKIALTVFLDDRLLKRLETPILKLGSDATGFRDDGENGDEEEGDHLFISKSVISREEFVQMVILDIEEKQGQLTVFLPSTSEAVVWLRTTESGVKMITEPTPSKVDTSNDDNPTNSTTVQVSSDKLAHVLWVAIALFSIAFAYVRNVVAVRWKEDVEPLIKKLDNWADQEKKDDSQS